MSENKALSPVKRLSSMLSAESVKSQFKNSLKDNADLFLASILDIYSTDTYLQKCEPAEVIQECLKAATLKLPINKGLGFAWIIARKKNKKVGNTWTSEYVPGFQIGWKGIVQLAQRTSQYRYINCDVVLEGELIGYNKLTGEICLDGAAISDKVVGFFAYIELLNGFTKSSYWSKEKVEAHAIKYSQESKKAGKLAGNWEEHFESRAMSTVLKHLISKYGPMSVEMAQVFSSDREEVDHERQLSNEAAEEANQDVIDIKPEDDGQGQGQEEKKEEVKTVDGGQDMPDWM